MSLKHAQHNEKASVLLLSSNIYYDWVITTPFYAALHYIEFALFPFKMDGIKFMDFNTYHAFSINRNKPKYSKHQSLSMLFELKHPKGSFYYQWLFEQCIHVRYTNYQVSKETAILSINYLNELKKIMDISSEVI